jgi:hypothetical protein
MQSVLLLCAAVMSAVAFCVHTFIGGPRVAGPLLSSSHLPLASKWLNYYCWHIATVLLFAMAAGFSYSAVHPRRPELPAFLVALSGALCILSVMVALKGKIHPLRFPSTSLFAVVAILGLASMVI